MKPVTRIFLLITILFLGGRNAYALPEIMTDYEDSPFFMSSNVLPNIMILADNSGSMNEFAYQFAAYNPTRSYGGYFSASLHYTYNNSDPANPYWVVDPSGQWLGSFLNWATMRKIDIARKVLVGGLTYSRLANPSRPATGGLQYIKTAEPVSADYASTQTHPDLTNGTGWAANTSPYTNFTGFSYSYAVKDDYISGTSGAKCPTMTVTKKDTMIGSGCKLNITAAGTGCTVKVTAVSGGAVTAITLSAGGSGYHVNDILTISSGGNNATLKVLTLSGSAVATLSIVSGGTGYATSSTAKATNSGGAVLSATINAGGTNYQVGDVLTISGGGGNATATVTSISGGGAFGPVTGVSITSGGTGYVNTTGATTSSGSTSWTTKYCVFVQKDITQEPFEFVNNDVAGIIQKISTKARFGLTFFENNAVGGKVAEPIGATWAGVPVPSGYSSTFISSYETGSVPKTSTPLAETMWEIMGYFKQSTTMRQDSTYYPVNPGGLGDPFYYSDAGKLVECGKNYVMILTDGEPTDDDFSDITAASKPAAAVSTLDAIALTAHTTDLRTDIASPPNQVLTVYTVYLFGDPTSGGNVARSLLNNTAKNGGFIDSNGDNIPNGSNAPSNNNEWHTTANILANVDASGNPVNPAVPQADTFYAASDADTMESQIMAAFTDILKRASSGTAISVLATSSSGAGDIFQAYFLPSKTIIDSLGSRDLTWTGHLLSLQVDNNGSLLDVNNNCIAFNFDTPTNSTVINTLDGVRNACGTNITATTPLTSFTNYNWDAGVLLGSKTASSRNIFTFLDLDNNGVVGTGEKLDFTTTNATTLQKYLRTASSTEAANVISWVRGENVAGYRNRTLNVGGDQYKLGDIIHSTPTVVGAPQENYSALYHDAGYGTWFASQKNRTTMVYIGANDGMLHAFNATTGDEVWAYIPYNVLPHLKWLTDNSYPHVDYVDLKVKISDINFGTTAAPNWKTVLIGGMRFGGGEISDTSYPIDGRKWRSSYFAIDVTDPANPVPLWEWNPGDNSLGFTMSYPAIVKIGDEFFAVVGSGPTAAYKPLYDGTSTQNAKLFVINIKTGKSVNSTAISGAITAGKGTSFPISDAYSFFSDPVSVDIDFSTSNPVVGGTGTSYNTDAVYIGESYWKPASSCPASCLPSCNVAGTTPTCGTWNSRMWRIATNNDVDPANWKMYDFFNDSTGQSITAAPGAAMDSSKNLWIFYGTGKYLNGYDKSDTNQQAFYGIKDPCWNGSTGAWNATCSSWGSLNTAGSYTPSVLLGNLVDTTNAAVASTSAVTGVTGATTFNALKSLIASKSGWYMYFSTSPSLERSLNKPSVVGGIVLFTTFVPATDPCALGGNSWFYAVYFETGSAYSSSIIGTSGSTVLRKSATSSVGMASSIAIHAGRESGAKAYVQMSTGQASVINLNTATKIKSGIIAWREL